MGTRYTAFASSSLLDSKSECVELAGWLACPRSRSSGCCVSGCAPKPGGMGTLKVPITNVSYMQTWITPSSVPSTIIWMAPPSLGLSAGNMNSIDVLVENTNMSSLVRVSVLATDIPTQTSSIAHAHAHAHAHSHMLLFCLP